VGMGRGFVLTDPSKPKPIGMGFVGLTHGIPYIRGEKEQGLGETVSRIESVEKVCRVHMDTSRISQAKPCHSCSKKIWGGHTISLQLLIWFLCHLQSVCAAPISSAI
jgi:hypothetical protein